MNWERDCWSIDFNCYDTTESCISLNEYDKKMNENENLNEILREKDKKNEKLRENEKENE